MHVKTQKKLSKTFRNRAPEPGRLPTGVVGVQIDALRRENNALFSRYENPIPDRRRMTNTRHRADGSVGLLSAGILAAMLVGGISAGVLAAAPELDARLPAYERAS